MWRQLVCTTRRMALCLVLLASTLLTCVVAALFYVPGRYIKAQGVLKPLDPRQVNAERRPEDWRVEVSIPKEDARRLRRPGNTRGELDVDILLASEPTRVFRGKLAIPAEAAANDKDENAALQARIHPIDGDIPGELCVPADQLLAGVSARMRIRANN